MPTSFKPIIGKILLPATTMVKKILIINVFRHFNKIFNRICMFLDKKIRNKNIFYRLNIKFFLSKPALRGYPILWPNKNFA